MSMAGKCKVVRGSNGARKVCWGRNGKIKSNTPASGGGSRKRKATSSKRKSTVSRSTAKTFVAKASYAKTKSGKLRKGCRKVGSTYRCKRPGKR